MSGPEKAPPVAIRPVERGDLVPVLRLWAYLDALQSDLDPVLATVEDAEALWTAEFNSMLDDPGVLALVATIEREVVGLVTAHVAEPRPLYQPDLFVFVDEIVVAPAWRQRGVAKRLVEQVQAWAHGLGIARVEARVVAAGEAARAFWRSVGGEAVAVTMRLSAKPGAAANA